VKVNKTVLV